MVTLSVNMAEPTLRKYGTPTLQQRFIPALDRVGNFSVQTPSEMPRASG